MKFYSEKLHKMYDSEKELHRAENDFELEEKAKKEKAKKLSDERKARAKEIDDAREAVRVAEAEYRKLLNAFVKDYGSYHTSVVKTNFDEDFSDFFDSLFKLF